MRKQYVLSSLNLVQTLILYPEMINMANKPNRIFLWI
jgi:hypothetical protein